MALKRMLVTGVVALGIVGMVATDAEARKRKPWEKVGAVVLMGAGAAVATGQVKPAELVPPTPKLSVPGGGPIADAADKVDEVNRNLAATLEKGLKDAEAAVKVAARQFKEAVEKSLPKFPKLPKLPDIDPWLDRALQVLALALLGLFVLRSMIWASPRRAR